MTDANRAPRRPGSREKTRKRHRCRLIGGNGRPMRFEWHCEINLDGRQRVKWGGGGGASATAVLINRETGTAIGHRYTCPRCNPSPCFRIFPLWEEKVPSQSFHLLVSFVLLDRREVIHPENIIGIDQMIRSIFPASICRSYSSRRESVILNNRVLNIIITSGLIHGEK